MARSAVTKAQCAKPMTISEILHAHWTSARGEPDSPRADFVAAQRERAGGAAGDGAQEAFRDRVGEAERAAAYPFTRSMEIGMPFL